MKDSFIVYRSFHLAISELNDKDRLMIYDAIFEFGLNHKEIELKQLPKAMWHLIKPQLEANHRKYLNGKLGGKATKEKWAKQGQSKGKLIANVEQANSKLIANVNDNVNVNVNEKKRGSFSAPSLLEVQQIFIKKLGNSKNAKLEAELFYNFYGSKNWHVGKNKMKNYKLAIAGWITRKKIESNEKPNKQARAEQLQASTNREFGVSL